MGLRKINRIQTNFEWKTLILHYILSVYLGLSFYWNGSEIQTHFYMKKHHIFSVIGFQFLTKMSLKKCIQYM